MFQLLTCWNCIAGSSSFPISINGSVLNTRHGDMNNSGKLSKSGEKEYYKNKQEYQEKLSKGIELLAAVVPEKRKADWYHRMLGAY